jgi:hypothetical protein
MADAANDLEEHGMVRTLKDLFAGAAGGIAQVLLGEFHSSPFPRIINRSWFHSSSQKQVLPEVGKYTNYVNCTYLLLQFVSWRSYTVIVFGWDTRGNGENTRGCYSASHTRVSSSAFP